MVLAVALTLLASGTLGLPGAEVDQLAARTVPHFIPNEGQWDERASGRIALGNASAWLASGGWTLDLRGDSKGVVLDFRIEASSESAEYEFTRPTAGVRNYLIGSDPSQWVTGVSAFEQARLSNVRAGVDLVLRTVEGVLEYDLELDAQADLAGLSIRVKGSEGVELTSGGALLVHTALGAIEQQPPMTWSLDSAGAKRLLPCRFVVHDSEHFGFAVDGWNQQHPLTIDPGLDWSSFLGGFDADLPADVVVDPFGRTLVAGGTNSFDYPASPGAYDLILDGSADAFVTCFAEDGSGFVWSTLLGGSDAESATALHIADDLKITVAGETRSANFPTTMGAVDVSHNGFSDVFVCRLNRDGSELLASTLLGGAGSESVAGIDRNALGEVVIGGTTNNGTFPTTIGALQQLFQGGPFSGTDCFVARFSSDLTQLRWSTFLGGLGSDVTGDVQLTAQDDVQLCGRTGSSNFPTASAFDSTLGGASDGFLCELAAAGNSLNWSTLLGGSGADSIEAFGRSPSGLVVGGTTDSVDFPVTAGAFQSTIGGALDAFVASLSNGVSTLDWATYLGHELDDELADLTVDSTGHPIAVGRTESRFFPATPWGFQSYFRGPYTLGAVGGDGWLSRLEPDGSQMPYGSFVGGPFDDAVTAVTLGLNDQCHLVGRTMSSAFPTSIGVVDPVFDFSGFGDGFALSLDFARFPFVFGTSKLTSGFYEPYLGWNGFPSLRENDFEITVDDAWPSTGSGTLLASATRVNIPQMGGSRYVGAPARRAATTTLGFFGTSRMSIPIQPWMVGKTLYFQFVFQDASAAAGLGLSNGMAVTFYP